MMIPRTLARYTTHFNGSMPVNPNFTPVTRLTWSESAAEAVETLETRLSLVESVWKISIRENDVLETRKERGSRAQTD
jgi:hypothetical protein